MWPPGPSATTCRAQIFSNMVCGVDTKDGLRRKITRCHWSPQLQIAIVGRVKHERRGEPLTRRAVLRLMAAATGPAGAGVAPAPLARPVPSSGEKIPAVGLGTWRTFDVGASATERAPLTDVLRRFAELGGRVVDSSPMYGAAESVVGDLATDLAITDKLFLATQVWTRGRDRKSTRLNSSHLVISYAVFCLKKKKRVLLHYRVNV